MKKFSRCALILILVTVIGAVGGYFYADKVLSPVYASETVLYVVVDESSEASLRSKDGGLNDDFEMLIKGASVISEAQRTAGTSEAIDKYLQVVTPPNSNIIKIICTNADAQTAKTYVDAVAKAAVNTLGNTIPVKSVKILSAGTVSSKSYKPEQYTYTAAIAGLAAAACLVIEILVLLCMSAFRKKEDNSDDESEYERRYGNVVYLPAGENFSKSTRRNDDLSNDDNDIEIESDNAEDNSVTAKSGKSEAKKNVSDEKRHIAEEAQEVKEQAEASRQPEVKKYDLAEEEQRVDDVLFEEAVIDEPAFNEAALSLEAPQTVYDAVKETESKPVYSAAKETADESAYGSAKEAANEFTYGAAKETANESAYGSAKETANESAYGSAKEAANESAYGFVKGTANESAYGSAKEAVNESAYGSAKEAANEFTYGSVKEKANEYVYGAENENTSSSIYSSMAEEMFMEAGNEAEAAKDEPVADGMTKELKTEPVLDRISEELKTEQVMDRMAEEPEDLPVMDAVLQAQQPVSSQYIYKGEEENVPSTAEVSSKYLYRGDESYKKPVLEPAEKKQSLDEYSEDIGTGDMSENPTKDRKKSRIIGIIRK